MRATASLLVLLPAAARALVSDEWAVRHLLNAGHASATARRLQPGPGGGGPPGGGGGAPTTSGAATSTACGTSACTTLGGGNFMSRASLTWSTATGTFSGSFVTNGCPNHKGAYEFNGVRDALVPASGSSCIQQTMPAPAYATTPAAAPLRSVIGYSISGGENLYGPMDAGFTLSQVFFDEPA